MKTIGESELLSRFDDSNIFELPGGHRIIAGEYLEPMQKLEVCLVDYVPSSLLAAPDVGDRLAAWARHSFPETRMMLVRTPELDRRMPGYDDYLYYILLTDAPVPHADESEIEVREAGPDDLNFVGSLLVEAFDDGLDMRADPVPQGAATSQAAAVLRNSQARSFVATSQDERIGQATVLLDQRDEVSGLEFIELLDFLVERTHPRRYNAESALVTACWKLARDLGRPLLSHIVVREKTCHCAGVELMILDRVLQRGWTFSHKYERLMLDEPR